MKTKSETYQIEQDLQWENPSPGMKRQIMGYDGQIMVVKVDFEEGAVGTMHEHYHSQATYVDSGEFELTIDGKTRTLKRGDGYYVAPDELHGCVCKKAGRLIDVFSPVRADFLNRQ